MSGKRTRLDGAAERTHGWVQRADVGRLRKAVRTPSNGVRVPAAVARAGILEYLQPDGSVVREFVPPDELARPEALASLRDAVVTVGHPGGGARLVSPDTYRDDAVGHVSGDGRLDGDHLVAELVVLDAEAIGRIDTGELVEVSAGYLALVDPTPGTFEGEPYDQIQREREYNHVALLPAGAGRAGETVSLRLDSTGNQIRTGAPRERFDMKTERIDGIEYEVGTAAWVQARARFDAAQKKRLDELEEAAEAATEEKAKADSDLEQMKLDRDALSAKVDELTAKIAELEDPEKMDARADSRAELMTRARSILGEAAELRGKPDLEIMRAALAKAEVKTDGLSDERIRGRFEGLTDGKVRTTIDPLHRSRADAFEPTTGADDGFGDYFETREAPAHSGN